MIPSSMGQQIRQSGTLDNLTITHREYVREIKTVSGEDYTTYEVNPGLPLAFPWLSGIAERFESYLYLKLTYVYVPIVGSNTDGAVAIAPDYDAGDDNTDLTKSQIMQFQDTVRGPLWAPLKMNCTLKNLRKRVTYYTRNAPLKSNLDIKTYDALKLHIMTTGAEEATAGELWVEYSVRLQTPQIDPSVSVESKYQSNDTTASRNPFAGAVMEVEGVLDAVLDDTRKITIKEPGDFMISMDGSYDPTAISIGTFGDISVDSGEGTVENYYDLPLGLLDEFSFNDLVTAGSKTSPDNPLVLDVGLLGTSASGFHNVLTLINRIDPSITGPFFGKKKPNKKDKLRKRMEVLTLLKEPRLESQTGATNQGKERFDFSKVDVSQLTGDEESLKAWKAYQLHMQKMQK